MIVPTYWAESSLRHREGKQITVKRFGWSDESQAAAEEMAEARAQSALARILAGEKLHRSEPRVPYNGAEGVPIREEVVERPGNFVITRNAYGALCLNSPDALFVDIDHPDDVASNAIVMVQILALPLGVLLGIIAGSFVVGISTVIAGFLLASALNGIRQHQFSRRTPDRAAIARDRVTQFSKTHPDWGMRLYETPNGLRVLVTHRTFSPSDEDVQSCFRALGADKVYVAMCLRQQCFRARVSPKPWRIGMQDHIRPRPGTWPVKPERMPARKQWQEKYASLAEGYASCRFVAQLGVDAITPDLSGLVEWHDQACRANTMLPLA